MIRSPLTLQLLFWWDVGKQVDAQKKVEDIHVLAQLCPVQLVALPDFDQPKLPEPVEDRLH